jgi:hypothetical protein
MVSAGTLTQIRAQRLASLTSTCRIDRATDTTDSSSGYTHSWPAGSTVAFGVQVTAAVIELSE